MKHTLKIITTTLLLIFALSQSASADVSLYTVFPNLGNNGESLETDIAQSQSSQLHDVENFTLVDLPEFASLQSLDFERVDGVVDERTLIMMRTANGVDYMVAPDHSLFVAQTGNGHKAVLSLTSSYATLLVPSGTNEYMVVDTKSTSESLTSKRLDEILGDDVPWQCHTADFLEQTQAEPGANSQVHSSEELLIADIALELDSDFFRRMNKDPDYEVEYITNVYGMVNVLYGEYMNIRLKIRIIDLWLDPSFGAEEDPYNGNDISSLLDQFRVLWTSSRGGLQRTLAQLVSSPGSTSVGGIAYLNTLCRNDRGFSVVGIRGSVNEFPVHNYVWDVMVVAHELGHNFSSPHTHVCDWGTDQNTYAIDSCVSRSTWPRADDACTQNSPRARLGTIMSYCHLNSMGSSLVFHPEPAARIRAGAERATCMSTPDEPTLHMLRPLGRQQISAGPVEVTWSSHLVDQVHVFAMYDGEEQKTLLTTVPASDRSATVDIPADKTSVILRIESTVDGTLYDETWGVLTIRPSNSVESETPQLQAYFNPTSTRIEITHQQALGDVALVNLAGATVLRGSFESQEASISVGHLPAGVYIVRVSNEHMTTSKKVLITQ